MTDITKSAYFIAKQKMYCEEAEVDFKKAEELNSIIAPLLRNLPEEKWEIVFEKIGEIDRKLGYCIDVFRLALSSKEKLTPRQNSFVELYAYLVMAEGIFSEMIHVIAFILTENHHDIYDPEKREFVRSYEGLNNLSLLENMQFVEMHGFKFVSDACDRDLRNSIAHLRIIVNDDGSITEITRKGKTGKALEDITRKTINLAGVCGIVLCALRGLTEENVLKRF